jgi:hypothetical protein
MEFRVATLQKYSLTLKMKQINELLSWQMPDDPDDDDDDPEEQEEFINSDEFSSSRPIPIDPDQRVRLCSQRDRKE